MIIGIPKEIKNDEYRVALTPAGVEAMRPAAVLVTGIIGRRARKSCLRLRIYSPKRR